MKFLFLTPALSMTGLSHSLMPVQANISMVRKSTLNFFSFFWKAFNQFYPLSILVTHPADFVSRVDVQSLLAQDLDSSFKLKITAKCYTYSVVPANELHEVC